MAFIPRLPFLISCFFFLFYFIFIACCCCLLYFNFKVVEKQTLELNMFLYTSYMKDQCVALNTLVFNTQKSDSIPYFANAYAEVHTNNFTMLFINSYQIHTLMAFNMFTIFIFRFRNVSSFFLFLFLFSIK